MTRTLSLFGTLLLASALGLIACSSSKATNTPPGSGSSNSTVAPATVAPATVAPATVAPRTTTSPSSAPPCTIPQNNGGDHDSDNNGAPSDGDGCNI